MTFFMTLFYGFPLSSALISDALLSNSSDLCCLWRPGQIVEQSTGCDILMARVRLTDMGRNIGFSRKAGLCGILVN